MREGSGVRFRVVFQEETFPPDERVEQLRYWAKRFGTLGIIPESAGNLSFRTGAGFVITGAGVDLGALPRAGFAEVVRVEGRGQFVVYVRGGVVPSSESLLHAAIYDLRPEAQVVFHTHDELVLTAELEIPSTENEQPWGSYELSEEVRKLLRRKPGIKYFVLKNHGTVAIGETLDEAGRLTVAMHARAREKR